MLACKFLKTASAGASQWWNSTRTGRAELGLATLLDILRSERYVMNLQPIGLILMSGLRITGLH